MNSQDRWLLPAGIAEILPPETTRLEYLRRRLIDLYLSWGYELVMPPMIEYLESLLLERGDALDLQTFKLTDQLTGRLMGVRADMTPQVARIDAYHLKRQIPTRLCYVGTVLHTRPNNFAGSRSPLQIGAELYGYEGLAGDLEIITLMLESLREIGLTDYHLDVGHLGIYQNLVQSAQLTLTQSQQLREVLKRKASAEVDTLLTTWQLATPWRNWLSSLVHLYGEATILTEARRQFAMAPPAIHQALSDLEYLASQFTHLPIHFDLAETRGYKYHNGLVFAVYRPKQGQAIAKGGRYDISEQLFGQKRSATGFSTNLRTLISLLPAPAPSFNSTAIFAPTSNDPKLAARVAELRQQGQIVIRGLPNQLGDAKAMGCRRQLRWTEQGWEVVDSDQPG